MSAVAIVDIGTNTTRLLIAEVEDGRVVRELERDGRVTRLGAGVDADGRLGDEALAREHPVLAKFAARIEARGAERRVAVMTSAVRDAVNGREFADEVSRRYGLDVHVLSGEEEAQLTYLGATDEMDPEATERVLVVDIGGGSTELVIGRGREVEFHASTQAGVVRQGDRHVRSDPIAPEDVRAVAEDVRGTIAAAVPEEWRRGIERGIAVAGTPTSLAAIAQDLDRYDSSRVHGYELTARVRDEILARLQPMTLEERRHVTGLHPDRALVIVPGIVILAEVMTLFGLDAVTASEHDILRGAALAFRA